MEAPYEIWLMGQAVSEEKMLNECGRWMDNGAGLCYKLTYEPKGSGELKKMGPLIFHTNSIYQVSRSYL